MKMRGAWWPICVLWWRIVKGEGWLAKDANGRTTIGSMLYFFIRLIVA